MFPHHIHHPPHPPDPPARPRLSPCDESPENNTAAPTSSPPLLSAALRSLPLLHPHPPTHPPTAAAAITPLSHPPHPPAASPPLEAEPVSVSPPSLRCSPAFRSGETPRPGAGIRSSSESQTTRRVILADGGKASQATKWRPLREAHMEQVAPTLQKKQPLRFTRRKARRSFVEDICKPECLQTRCITLN